MHIRKQENIDKDIIIQLILYCFPNQSEDIKKNLKISI